MQKEGYVHFHPLHSHSCSQKRIIAVLLLIPVAKEVTLVGLELWLHSLSVLVIIILLNYANKISHRVNISIHPSMYPSIHPPIYISSLKFSLYIHFFIQQIACTLYIMHFFGGWPFKYEPLLHYHKGTHSLKGDKSIVITKYLSLIKISR